MAAIIDYGGYDSDLEEPPPKKPLMAPDMDSKMERSYKTNQDKLGGFTSYSDKESWKTQTFHLRKMDAYDRHKELIKNYVKLYGGKVEDFNRDSSKDRNDFTVVKENHKFLWESEKTQSWEERIAKRYYDKLFKEYCIADLSKYESQKIALRWRIESEVRKGKGQFICGSKACSETLLLCSWEVNFAYVEQNEKKNALVKVRLCPDCSIKLNMVKKVNKISKKKKKSKHKKKRSRSRSNSSKEIDTNNPEVAGSSKDNEPDIETAENVWKGPAPETLVKSNEDQMDEFLDDLFL